MTESNAVCMACKSLVRHGSRSRRSVRRWCALDRYGSAFGLPRPYSGQNSYWFWGPPPAADSGAVTVGLPPAFLHRWFTTVRVAAVYHNGLHVSGDEEGTLICVATGLRTSRRTAWPAFRHYG